MRNRLLVAHLVVAISAILLVQIEKRNVARLIASTHIQSQSSDPSLTRTFIGNEPAADEEGGAENADTESGEDAQNQEPGSEKRGLRDALNPGLRSAAGRSWNPALHGAVRQAGREGKKTVRGAQSSRLPRTKRASARRKKRSEDRYSRPVRSRTSTLSISDGNEKKAPARSSRKSSGSARVKSAAQNSRLRPDFDGQNSSGGSRAASGTGLSYISLYSPSRAKKEKAASKRAEKFKPPTLSQWIGKGPLKPPASGLKAPSFSDVKRFFPATLPDGKGYEQKTPKPAHLEMLWSPGEHLRYARWLEKDAARGRRDEPHWHIDESNTPYYHMGDTWGVAFDGNWSWMKRSGKTWWTIADGAQRMVRHQERWWWRTRDGWFLLHQGEPWAYRHFADWKQSGLIHPGTNTRIVYSEDGERVAIVAPDGSARVFDARSGKLLVSTPATK